MNINTNFNAGAPPMMLAGLSGRSLMTRSNSFQAGRNQAQTGPAFRDAMLDIRQTADALRGAMRDMMGLGQNQNSPFGSMFAVSGDTDILTIGNSGRFIGDPNQAMSVEVLQLATQQRNEGTARTANAATPLGVGNHQLSLTVGNQTFDINFQVGANDTNADVNRRIADAVNARNIGVTASVATEGTGDARTSALVLQSRETATSFTAGGNAAAALGVNTVTQEAQQAQFRVNRGELTGALQTANTNNVNLGFGTTATLQATGTANITRERDELGQINAIRNMVNLFNDLVEVAQDNRAGANGGRLERDLRSMIHTSQSQLARVGITTNAHGFLDINEERMREAAASGALETFAQPGGAQSGFLGRVERMADRVGRNAPNFVGATPMNNADFDFANMSANWNNQFNNWMNAGMLFDSMF